MKKIDVAKNSENLLQKLSSLSQSELANLVLFHNKKYFEENNPEISDEAFDKLVESLRFLDPNAEALKQIGHKKEGISSFGDEVAHQRPMLSLEKCYDDASFFKWADKINGDFIAMPKRDGVACSIIYSQNGDLVLVSTRGDGKVGENITKNAVLIPDVPSHISLAFLSTTMAEDTIEIRGEVFLPLSIFKEKFAEEFASPRNLAAGFLKLKEGDPTKNCLLKFFPYDVRGSLLKTEEEKFNLLSSLGFSMMPWSKIKNDTRASDYYFDLLKRRALYDFEIDGVVYRADALNDQMRLGETAHHPKYAIAYKFQGESAQTKLLDVQWSVARSGIITPVAIVEPVFVSGASITRASLHNLGIFLQHDLREETLVEINRRGGVIPYLERVLSRKGPALVAPKKCPSCDKEVVVDGDFLKCGQPYECEEVVVGKLIHFCHVLGIEGLGEKIIRKLFHAGMLKKFGDIFRLNEENFQSIERMGDVLSKKLLDEINRKRTVNLATFLRALGINEIGANVSELIASNFPSYQQIKNLNFDELLLIQGIGESIANSLINGLKENADDIEDVLKEIKIGEQELDTLGLDPLHPLFGKSVVFTGKMAHLERKSAQREVKKLGGKTPDAISGNVNFLVIGDEGSPLLGAGKKSTKQKTAEKLIAEGYEITIISERDFLKMIKKSIE